MSLRTSRSGGWKRLTRRMVKMNWADIAAEATGGAAWASVAVGT
jgi:hypothetical protein